MISKTFSSITTSFQKNSWSNLSDLLTVEECLLRIKTGTYQAQVETLRKYLAEGDTEYYDREKRRLPAVTFSASFNQKRNRSSISVYNQLLVLDFDKLSKELMEDLKSHFRKDSYVWSFWESPSGSGLKGLINLDFSSEFPNNEINFRHTYAFRKVFDYMKEKYGIELDKSGSDVTRLCFFSYDPHLFIRDESTPFLVEYNEAEAAVVKATVKTTTYSYVAEPTENQKFNASGKNSQLNRTEVQSIIRYLSKRGLSITGSFHNWYQIAYALANTFTYELGMKYFIALSKLDGNNFNEAGCQNMIDYCYANSMGNFTFATIVYFAKQVGYKGEKEVPKVEEML
ncbi:BT4734/BF3469 family protein [Sphingobacterium daejeonense]|uniref:BT4734/BF3469 family protein n=1 Tax=Sphingobacterium daejeonense TaxID=371142 RepID=UPI003D31CD95